MQIGAVAVEIYTSCWVRLTIIPLWLALSPAPEIPKFNKNITLSFTHTFSFSANILLFGLLLPISTSTEVAFTFKLILQGT